MALFCLATVFLWVTIRIVNIGLKKQSPPYTGLRLRIMDFAAYAWPNVMNASLGIRNNFVELKASDVGSYEEYLGSVFQ